MPLRRQRLFSVAGQPTQPNRSRQGHRVRALIFWRSLGSRASRREEDTPETCWPVAQLVENRRSDQAPEPVPRDRAEQLTKPAAVKAEVDQPRSDVDEVRLPHELDLEPHCQ